MGQQEYGLEPEMVAQIAAGKYTESLAQLKSSNEDELKQLYKARENEPDLADESWVPENKALL